MFVADVKCTDSTVYVQIYSLIPRCVSVNMIQVWSAGQQEE